MKQNKKFILIFYTLLVACLALLGFILYFESQNSALRFYVFDVGQGDSMLIRTPYRQNILIDGGPDNTVVYKLGEYLPFYNRQIDLMILTHPHADHVVGLVEVLRRYEVKNVFFTGVDYNEPSYLVFLDLIKKKNLNFRIIDRVQRISLGEEAELVILYPDKDLSDKEIKNLNNTSIVAKLIYRDNSIMLTGDYEDEEALVGKGFDLSADILKVGHHGSDTANDRKFLKAVDPDQAIISCGQDNKFGHPHEQTIKNFEDLEAEILRTDQQGDIFSVLN